MREPDIRNGVADRKMAKIRPAPEPTFKFHTSVHISRYIFRLIYLFIYRLINDLIALYYVPYPSGPQPSVCGPVPVRGSNDTGQQAAHFIETQFNFLGLYPKLKTSVFH